MNDLMFLRKALAVLWIGLGMALTGWIVFSNVPPSGLLKESATAGALSAFIGIPRPVERVKIVASAAEPYYEVLGEPLYFQLAAPRFFPRAKVRLEFQNSGQPVIELGARSSADQWRFDLHPIDAPVLDNLGWSARQDGDLLVYERTPTSRSAGDILASGSAARTAVYHLDPVRWGFRIGEASGPPTEIGRVLRGSHQFYVYLDRGPFDLSLSFRDLRSDRAKFPPASVRVIKEGGTILSRQSSGEDVDLHVTNAMPGVYRVEIDADNDVLINGIRTPMSKLVFIKHLRLYDGGESVPLDAAVAAGAISMATDRNEGLQTVSVGRASLEVAAVGTPARLALASGRPVRLHAPQGNLAIDSDGVIALSDAQFFDPEFPVVGADFRADGGIDTVVADYRPPVPVGEGWFAAEAAFEPGKLAISNGEIQMALSLPALKTVAAPVRIRKIDVEYEREPLTWQTLLEAIKRKL